MFIKRSCVYRRRDPAGEDITSSWRYLCAGLYAWSVSAFFGAILLDIVYSKTVSSTLPASQTAATFSEVADFLLLAGTLAILLAIGAISSSWTLGPARNLFIASILCVIVIEFLAPILFFSLLQMSPAKLGPNLGPSVRLVGSALSSLLAFGGLRKLSASAS